MFILSLISISILLVLCLLFFLFFFFYFCILTYTSIQPEPLLLTTGWCDNQRDFRAIRTLSSRCQEGFVTVLRNRRSRWDMHYHHHLNHELSSSCTIIHIIIIFIIIISIFKHNYHHFFFRSYFSSSFFSSCIIYLRHDNIVFILCLICVLPLYLDSSTHPFIFPFLPFLCLI